MTMFIDLVIDNGEIVRIEGPDKHEDEARESIEHALKRRDWWTPGMFDGCRAEYLGHSLDRINMGRVVGAL